MYYVFFKKDWQNEWICGIAYFSKSKGNATQYGKLLFQVINNQERTIPRYEFDKTPYTLKEAKRKYIELIFTLMK